MDDWSDTACAELACEAGDRITCPDNSDAEKSIRDVHAEPELKSYNDSGSPVEYSISHLPDGDIRVQLLAVRARHKEEHILDIGLEVKGFKPSGLALISRWRKVTMDFSGPIKCIV